MPAKFKNGLAVRKRPSENREVPTLLRKTHRETMSQTVVERTAVPIAESAHPVPRATCAVADAIEDGIGVVMRAAKQGGDAAEEFLNDTTRRI
jgi:hypothetical protein